VTAVARRAAVRAAIVDGLARGGAGQPIRLEAV
jgi:hypothetical protein